MRLISTFAACVFGTSALAGHALDNRDLAKGKSLYEVQCASCHGADLEGQPNWRSPGADGILPAPPHNADGHTWHHDTQLLFDYTRDGGKAALAAQGVTGFQSGMPGFTKTLTDENIWDILGYIQSTWPQRIQDIQASRSPPHS